MNKNLLNQLKQLSTVVADTGDFESMGRFTPTDATTNPSLILKAIRQPGYQHLLNHSLLQDAGLSVAQRTDRLLVVFGQEILKIVPGRVSTEVDARLSFDTEGTVERAREIMKLYESLGIERKRILIKIAATWEGIQAAKQLEAEGIACNVTLLFSLTQAIAAAQANVTLISPFVGRIYDWYKKAAGDNWDEVANAAENDPGVQSVSRIYAYFKNHGIATEIMGASFRNTGQILALAGCDLLTISPELLDQLSSGTGDLTARLTPDYAAANASEKRTLDEKTFRFDLNEDAMATEKLAEGIRVFVQDAIALDALLKS